MKGPRAGLCGLCRFSRQITSRRGSVFWICGQHRTDPTFPKYPRLPVLDCDSFEVAVEQGGSECEADRAGQTSVGDNQR